MKKSVFVAALGMFLLTACGGNASVTLKNQIIVEYGSELKVEDLTEQEGITLKEVKEYDAKKIGTQAIVAVFTEDNKDIEQEVTVTVKDTQAPEITFKSETVEVTLGDEIDTTSNIESVKDPVDGDIKQSTDNTITKDGYFITSDIKSEAGEYTVTVTAFDVNGNRAEKSYKLILKEKLQETVSTTQPQQSASSQSGSQAPSQSNGSNASSSQPSQSQPQPSQPEQSCDGIHPNAMGNSGQLFDNPKEAQAWANAYIEKDHDGGNGTILNYVYPQVFDMCGNLLNQWTVDFNYKK